ncbi:hypothetical protein [Massilia sp. Root335]|uniref:hypothetical protein n=1 Tax=Massilia sp. Root335 TaxID=1736517 RepID=UPI0012F6A610|nr:hypothetical protein [Massilia sp. Root335]
MKAPLLTTMSNFVSEISSCKWLFLNSIGEPEENSLRLEILEAATLHDPEAEARPLKESLERGLPLGSPIRHVAGCRIFTVEWPDYVAYSIRNESYVTTDEYEVFEGRNFVKYTKSRYLDFVEQATFASDSYPGPMTHWGVFCLNHIVDVVSCSEPTWQMSFTK